MNSDHAQKEKLTGKDTLGGMAFGFIVSVGGSIYRWIFGDKFSELDDDK